MKKVDRASYVLDKGDAYRDSPQYACLMLLERGSCIEYALPDLSRSISYGATISAPHMVCYRLDL
jgi:hypothetical protein